MATKAQREIHLKHVFVESAPADLDERTLYISVEYGSVIHRCCCGCGREVVTPLSPTDWKLTFDGVSISLWPSIGNWRSPCRSHYWIERGRVRWAEPWSEERIAAGREAETFAKSQYFGDGDAARTPPDVPSRRPGKRATTEGARPPATRRKKPDS